MNAFKRRRLSSLLISLLACQAGGTAAYAAGPFWWQPEEPARAAGDERADDAKDEADAEPNRGKLDYDSSTRVVDLQPNVEMTPPPGGNDLPPFSITFDDKTVVNAPTSGDRPTDLALAAMKIAITFDSLNQERYLNVSTDHDTAVRGEPITFRAYNNYQEWIRRAEVRIYPKGTSLERDPTWTVPIAPDGTAQWSPDGDTPDQLTYVLRVYDGDGRFDDTRGRGLTVRDERNEDEDEDEESKDESLAGWGVNHIKRATIPVVGGAVTANGFNVPEGYRVRFMGAPVPLDEQRDFVVQQILQSGNHEVALTVENEATGETATFTRALYLPENDWFYVALADLTIGENNVREGDPGLVQADTQHYDENTYQDARGAFYVKGRIKGEYLLTAAADTGEQPADEVFSNLADRDPRKLFRQLDPDKYYPVYGDDSVTQEDAPTQGRLYLRLERGDSYVLWGNFHTQISGTDLAKLSRGVYGAQLHWVSDDVTSFGERRTVVEGFAANPDTRSAREDLRGTGGSLYYLRRRDITTGSEQVTVEVRDKDSGLVVSVKNLAPTEDYDFDAYSGRILLREPLSTVADSASSYVRTDTYDGNPMYLVVRYEYAPSVSELDDLTYGGRATHWVNDQVQVGVTRGYEKQMDEKHEVQGVDATYRYSAGSYLRTEVARTIGPGVGEQISSDGGFTFSNVAQDNSRGIKAGAYRVEGNLSLTDVGVENGGDINVYTQQRDQGFSGEGQLTDTRVSQAGLGYHGTIREGTELSLNYDQTLRGDGGESRATTVDVHQKFDEHWGGGLGVRHDTRTTAATDVVGSVNEHGQRTDVAAQIDYDSGKNWDAYGFAQNTVSQDEGRVDNTRAGVGGNWQLNSKLGLNGEVSGGDRGTGLKAGATYQQDDKTELYMNYELDTDRTDDGQHARTDTIVSGSRTRYSDALSFYSERRQSRAQESRTLTNVYGATFAPTKTWSFGANLEKGDLRDTTGDTDRTAVSLSAGYEKDRTKWGGALEWRHDQAPTVKRRTWLVRTNVNHQTSPDWRFLGKLDLSQSTATSGATDTAKFVDFSAGWAYRPTDNDRFNALFKYTFYYDLPTSSQLSATGVSLDYAQRSHILNADFIYDLTEKLAVGAKLGVRSGELRNSRVNDQPWIESTTYLGILRADYHVVRNWDLFGELRGLRVDLADDQRSGVLVGAYRHFGDNMKAGVGYNFTDFDDDLTNLDYRYEGWFVNLVGKY